MRAQRTAGTSVELGVRRRLHAKGYRYRVDYRLMADQRFRGDIVWTRDKLVVFLDGCFWHGCPDHGTRPKSNTAWWASKLDGNRERDARATGLLTDEGWCVLRFWEHEDPDWIVDRIEDVLRRLRSARGPTRPATNRVSRFT